MLSIEKPATLATTAVSRIGRALSRRTQASTPWLGRPIEFATERRSG
jgi:hypothetical protein